LRFLLRLKFSDALFNDHEAIEFWNHLATEKFEIPLEDFCSAMIRRERLPPVKSLNISGHPSSIEIESYQKYWGLWLFAGGDDQTFSAYTKMPIVTPQSDCTISFHTFGLLLAWFGHFGKLLNEIFNCLQRKIFYDYKMSSVFSALVLKQNVNNSNYILKDLWLIRCSPKRDFPYVISFIKPDNSGQMNVTHQRIILNPITRQYTFQNLETKSVHVHETITGLMDIIQNQYELGKGFYNEKFKLLNQPELVRPQTDCYVST